MNPSNERTPRTAPRHVRAPRHSAVGSTLLGLFIGVALGLGLAAAVAFYLMRAGNPYQTTLANTRDVPREVNPVRAGKADAGATKPRFDFYKILPGAEEPKVQAKAADRSADKATVARTLTPDAASTATAEVTATPAIKAVERFWLQAGSFVNEGEAENLKARLALAGLEAAVQQADVPDRGVRYRVRLGPYDNTDELSRMKGELGRRGFEVAVIKY